MLISKVAEFLARLRTTDPRGSAFSRWRTMKKSLVCATSARFISFSRLSSFKLASKETLGPGTGDVHVVAGRFAVTRVTQLLPDWPCANLTYHSIHSRTLTTLLSSRKTLPERKDEEIYEIEERRRDEHVANVYVEYNSHLCFCIRSPWYFDNWPIRSAASLRLLIQIPPCARITDIVKQIAIFDIRRLSFGEKSKYVYGFSQKMKNIFFEGTSSAFVCFEAIKIK